MKFFVKIIVFLFFSHFVLFLNAQKLSTKAEISVITCDPGEELYSTFGHSAIRIKDPILRIDNVYNYGTFNFETPHFYLKFIRGKLDYMLSISPYRYFILSYKQEQRGIKEQILNLTYNQKNKIYKALSVNALPENVYYRYDFLKDNCSTRVLKIIKDAISDSLVLPEAITQNQVSYREMLMPYLKNKDWERFGINLALGRPVDKFVSVTDASFLPDYLYLIFNNSEIKTKTGIESIVKKEQTLYKPFQKIKSEKIFLTPSRLFWIFLIIVLLNSIFEVNRNQYFYIFDKTLLFIFGFVGLAILFLWFGTDHSSVINNQNVIWASPLFFIFAFILKKSNKYGVRLFFLIYSFLLLISLILNLHFVKLFDKAVNPLILILIIRTSLIWFRK